MTGPGCTTPECLFEAHGPGRVSISVGLISTAARLRLLLRMRIVVMWERRVDKDTNCRPCRVRGLSHCQRRDPTLVQTTLPFPVAIRLALFCPAFIAQTNPVKLGLIGGLQRDSVKPPAKVPGWPRESQGGAFRAPKGTSSLSSSLPLLSFSLQYTALFLIISRAHQRHSFLIIYTCRDGIPQQSFSLTAPSSEILRSAVR